MSKVRVYEVAKDLGMENKALVALLKDLGISEARNHMSVVTLDVVERVKRHLEKPSGEKVVEERIRPTVVKRRAKRAPEASSPHAAPAPSASEAVSAAETAPPARPTVISRGKPSAARAAEAASKQAEVASASQPEPAQAASPSQGAVEAAEPAAASDAAPRAAEPSAEAPKPSAEPVKAAPAQAEKSASSEPAAEAKEPSAAAQAEKPAAVEPAAAEPAKDAAAAAAPRGESQAAPQSEANASTATPEQAAPAVETPGASSAVEASAAEASKAAPVAQPPAAEAAAPESPAKTTDEKPPAEAAQTAPSAAASEQAAPEQAASKPAVADSSQKRPQQPARVQTPASRPAAPAAASATAAPSIPPRPSTPPKTGIDVWKGRPGVPMPQPPRGPTPRRVQYDAKAGVAGGPGQRGNNRGPIMGGGPPGRGGNTRGPGGAGNRRFSLAPKRGGGAILTQERSAHKKVVRIEDTITLQQLGQRMALKANQLLGKLMQLGMSGVHINSTLDADTAKIVANEFGWEVENVAFSEEEALKVARGLEEEQPDIELEDSKVMSRPPVVAVMGHVDHGKTSLLDRVRKSDVAAGEAGGITQHIGAYSVTTKLGRIAFLDTPGHAAFTAMRARGAQCTDLIILVVAADDGVMPQTREAVSHARAAKVPIVVAVNKIDKEDAQPERVRRELSELGLVPEEWGGDTQFTEISAKTGQGVDNLLEQVVLQAEIMELRANPQNPAVGVVVEAQLDRGMGALATVLVTDGTLRRGDYILAGRAFGKIRAMHDHNGRKLNEAGPSTPVSVIGLDDVPFAGDSVHAVKDSKKAQEIAQQRKTKNRTNTIAVRPKKMSLEEIAQQMSQNQALELKVIIKADVQGSVEALRNSLEQLSTEKVKVTVVHAAAGGITESDVNLAVAAGAMIVGFNVRPAGKASQLAQQEDIEIRRYEVIYSVVDDIKGAMEGLLAPKLVEKPIGKAEVLQVFRVSKAGTIAGCMVTEGTIRRNAGARVFRDEEVVYEGKLSSLKRFKDDVREVKNGFECGLSVEGWPGIEVGDRVEVFEMEEVKQTL